MKYDSSMTQFHADIVKVMRTMCGSDNEITKKFNPDDNSPAPLRDYLKAKHGSSVHGWGNANLYCDCRPKELKITVSQETIEFSWSQVTKFIRDNWEEIFKKTEDTQPSEKQPKEEQPTYINKLREKYPKINETDEWFDEIYCPYELLNGEGVSCIDDEKCAYGESDNACQKCWRERCPENVSFADDTGGFEKAYFKHYPEEKADEAVSETPEEKSETDDSAGNQIISQNANEISETFNYAVLSVEIGDYLRSKEQQLKNEYMSFTANCGAIFAEAQERLAKHGFGENNGIFEKWITSMGFAKPTVYRMISIYNFRSSQIETNEGQTFFDTLPKTLQADISAKSAPSELVKQVMDGDITTHAEYIKLKKELEEQRKQNEILEADNKLLNCEAEENDREYAAMADREDQYENKIHELNRRIKELESKPVDVAVDVDELNRRLAEKTVEMQNSLAQSIAEERRDFAEKLDRMESDQEKLEEENELLKKQLANRSRNEDVYVLVFTKSEIDALTRGKTPDDISARAKNAIKIGG